MTTAAPALKRTLINGRRDSDLLAHLEGEVFDLPGIYFSAREEVGFLKDLWEVAHLSKPFGRIWGIHEDWEVASLPAMNKQITSGLEKATPAVIRPAPAPSSIDGQALTPPVMWLSLLPLTLMLEAGRGGADLEDVMSRRAP